MKEIRYPEYVKLKSPKGTQIVVHVFDFSALRSENPHATLSKVMLRVYKDANSTNQCSYATLQHKVVCKPNSGQEVEIVGHKLDMSNEKNLIDIDLTETFRELWPIPDKVFEVYVTLILKSECEGGTLAIKLLDWKSTTNLNIRRKTYAEHPVLCMFISNEAVESVARKVPKPKPPIPSETLKFPQDDQSDWQK